jgi:hypothetical protein
MDDAHVVAVRVWCVSVCAGCAGAEISMRERKPAEIIYMGGGRRRVATPEGEGLLGRGGGGGWGLMGA